MSSAGGRHNVGSGKPCGSVGRSIRDENEEWTPLCVSRAHATVYGVRRNRTDVGDVHVERARGAATILVW